MADIRVDLLEERLTRFERNMREELRLARDRRERDVCLLYEEFERERRSVERRVARLESRLDRHLLCS